MLFFFQCKDGKRNADFDFKCFKFHFKFIRKTTTGSVPLKRRIGQWIWGIPFKFMRCVLLGEVTRCYANLFQDFPSLLHEFILYSSFKKINAGSILKVKVTSPKPDAILVAINKRINTNSNEAGWLANGKPCIWYYTCDHMFFMKWVISLNNMTVIKFSMFLF